MRLKSWIFAFTILLFSKSSSHADWLKDEHSRIREEDRAWLQSLTNSQSTTKSDGESFAKQLQKKPDCKRCKKVDVKESEQIKLRVFVSFSMSPSMWLSLSREMESFPGAVFILRGLPSNSFIELSKKLVELKQTGMTATVQVDPKAFREYGIERVPSFVFVKVDGTFDKVAGSVSLKYAADLFKKERHV